jgi:hypothetical protein
VTGQCRCGHSESAHVERRDPDIGILVDQHGGCQLCGCERFTWVSYANDEEGE